MRSIYQCKATLLDISGLLFGRFLRSWTLSIGRIEIESSSGSAFGLIRRARIGLLFLHLGRAGKLTLLRLVGREKKNRHFHARFREFDMDRQESV